MPGSIYCTFKNNIAWQLRGFPVQKPQHNAIYLWHGQTANLLHLYTDCYALLNAGEQARANRYFQLADRQRYVIQHGLLRQLLAWYLSAPLFINNFIYNNSGKPYLPKNGAQLCFFNLSHSAGEFLIAIGDNEMGVDIEQLKTGFGYQAIVKQYFGTAEQQNIAGAASPVETFFLLWTRKEALLKATGKGIDDNLPDVPALDGKHVLPGNYDNIDWLTTSFKAGHNSMVSISHAARQAELLLFKF